MAKSSYKKGMSYERIYKYRLEKLGYKVYRVSPRFIKTKNGYINLSGDMWHLFDLNAINDKEILYVQVTSVKSKRHSQKDIINFANEIKNPHITYILAKYDKDKDEFIEFKYKYGQD